VEDRKRGFIARVVEFIPWLQGRSAPQGEGSLTPYERSIPLGGAPQAGATVKNP